MSRFCTLASGSSGNCSFLTHNGNSILIDAGISCKAIVTALTSINASPELLKGILITHEHIDHIKGLKVFTKKYQIPIFTSTNIKNYLLENEIVLDKSMVIDLTNTSACVHNMEITSFNTPHDSVGSIGFNILLSGDKRIGVATDLGYVTDEVHKNLLCCDMVLLESNYDEQMLKTGSYPYYLKKRILSECGHLSNHDCSKLAVSLAQSGTTRFVLVHLSKDNNIPRLAFETTESALVQNGFKNNFDFKLSVAPRSEVSELIVL